MNKTPERLAQGQLDAYNAHDIELFCSFFANDIKVYDAHTQELLFEGMEAFRERYTQTFSNPELHCTVVKRMVLNNIVIDKELVSGFGEDHKEAIAIYHTKEDLIVQVHFY
jgi:hypothetical protein